LIMVIQRTITGVKFPSVPCEFQIACPPQRGPKVFNYTLKVVPDRSPCHRWWDVSGGAKPGVPFKKYVGKSDSEPYLFGMFYGYRCKPYYCANVPPN